MCIKVSAKWWNHEFIKRTAPQGVLIFVYTECTCCNCYTEHSVFVNAILWNSDYELREVDAENIYHYHVQCIHFHLGIDRYIVLCMYSQWIRKSLMFVRINELDRQRTAAHTGAPRVVPFFLEEHFLREFPHRLGSNFGVWRSHFAVCIGISYYFMIDDMQMHHSPTVDMCSILNLKRILERAIGCDIVKEKE